MTSKSCEAPSDFVPLRDYIDQRFDSYARATDLAEREREKAAVVIRQSLSAGTDQGLERLREHIQTQFKQVDIAMASAEKLELSRIEANAAESRMNFAASREAILKADSATEKRFEGVNEFRAQLADQAATFITRKEAEMSIKGTCEALAAELKAANEKIASNALNLAGLNTSAAAVVANTATITELRARMDRNDGKSKGLGAMWGYVAGGVGFIAVVVGLWVSLSNIKPAVETNAAKIERNTQALTAPDDRRWVPAQAMVQAPGSSSTIAPTVVAPANVVPPK